jgi:hypothetical protein
MAAKSARKVKKGVAGTAVAATVDALPPASSPTALGILVSVSEAHSAALNAINPIAMAHASDSAHPTAKPIPVLHAVSVEPSPTGPKGGDIQQVSARGRSPRPVAGPAPAAADTESDSPTESSPSFRPPPPKRASEGAPTAAAPKRQNIDSRREETPPAKRPALGAAPAKRAPGIRSHTASPSTHATPPAATPGPSVASPAKRGRKQVVLDRKAAIALQAYPHAAAAEPFAHLNKLQIVNLLENVRLNIMSCSAVFVVWFDQ